MLRQTLFFLLLIGQLHAQSTVAGVVKDAATGTPLPYVNVGVVGKNIGTVTDEAGAFEMAIAKEHDLDQVKISMVGYQPKAFRVADLREMLRKEPVIFLEEAVYSMTEVVVYGKEGELREKIVGNPTETRRNRIQFSKDLLGNEMGIVIKNKKRPIFIKDFNVNILENGHETFKFRINLYSVKNGLPAENILQENIIVSSSIREGMLTVDLTPYNIWVTGNFFISMEWIEDLGDNSLEFSLDNRGRTSPTITRTTSQAQWAEVGKAAFGTGIGIWLTVKY